MIMMFLNVICGLIRFMPNKNPRGGFARFRSVEIRSHNLSEILPAVLGRYFRRMGRGVPAVWVILVFGLFDCGVAQAFDMTDTEHRLLPPYCRNHRWVASRSSKLEAEREWMNILGQDYYVIHHYCWAIVSVSRSYRPGLPDRVRKHHLELAVADIHFSTDKATPGFVLLPEIYTKLGEAYLGLHDDKNAEVAFRTAWEAKPSYWPPYVWWAQRLLKQGKVREALLVAEEGKKNAPDAKAIDKLMDEIKAATKAGR